MLKPFLPVAVGAVLLATAGIADELFTADDFLDWQTERQKHGYCTAQIVPAPGRPGKVSIKLTYHCAKAQVGDWIDYVLHPIPPRSLTDSETSSVDVYPAQAGSRLTLKITDPDAPGANHSSFENPLTASGKPLKANEWNRCAVRLRQEPKHRDSIDQINFYVSLRHVPKDGTTYTYHIGILDPPQFDVRGGAAKSTRRGLASADFEDGQVPAWARTTGHVTDADDAVVCGKRSLLCDTMESQKPWHEFFRSEPARLRFETGKTYAISFDYRITAAPSGAPGHFYFMMRSDSLGIKADRCWLRWQGTPGQTGFRGVKFRTDEANDYRLTIGIRNRGGLAIDNVRVEVVADTK